MGAEDPADSWSLLIRELRGHLRRQADREVTLALAIGIDLSRGFTATEVRQRHGLTLEEYADGAGRAQRAMLAHQAQNGAAA